MSEVASAVEKIKDSDSSVLITGESGTGKELVAWAIHRLSKRNHQDFIPFNCTAGSAELIESTLFGHRKGAFTGAYTEHAGLIRAAEGGTAPVLRRDDLGDAVRGSTLGARRCPRAVLRAPLQSAKNGFPRPLVQLQPDTNFFDS